MSNTFTWYISRILTTMFISGRIKPEAQERHLGASNTHFLIQLVLTRYDCMVKKTSSCTFTALYTFLSACYMSIKYLLEKGSIKIYEASQSMMTRASKCE